MIKLSSPATHEFWEIPVVFEDEHLLALDKPPGLLTSRDGANQQQPNLMDLLHAGIAAGKPWVAAHQLSYLAQPHELEAETGGVVLLAKTKAVLVKLADWFGTAPLGQKRVALVHGSPAQEHFEVNARLAAHPLRPEMVRVDPQAGKKSRTVFDVLERFAQFALVRCQPTTCRPHQVRVHLQNSGLRIVGDELYGGRPLLLSSLKSDYRLKPGRVERPLISRVALHADELTLPHPVTGETLTVTSPWPKDLRVAVKYLREYGR